VREEVTSARETYDQEGAVRSESERNSSRTAQASPGGIPGVATNTPPPDPELVEGPPNPDAGAPVAEPAPRDTESAMQRNYELGREVAVTSSRPGGVVKLSVAIAVSEAAIEAAAPMTAEQLQTLVSTAVGADEDRGDQVRVVVGAFDNTEMPPLAFYEQAWFTQILRIVAGLIAVLLVLLLAVRPLIKAIKDPENEKASKDKKGMKDAKAKPGYRSDEARDEEVEGGDSAYTDGERINGNPSKANESDALETIHGNVIEGTQTVGSVPEDVFDQRISAARQLALAQPDRAVEVLQRMIDEPEDVLEEVEVKS